ncbi:MAG TPA: hypothetical protein VFU02_08775 [Polyangiaceae bacterium]|nr:hypothetical protein [Polyangiaceae bacterium]
MRRATWLLLTALGVGGVGVGLGIAFEPDRRPPLPPPRVSAPLAASAQEPVPAASIDTAPAKSSVAEFRSRRLNLEPQAGPSPGIAISGPRVGRIEQDSLVVVEPGTKKKSLTLTLPGAFAVVATPGALLAVGKDHLLVLANGERTPRSMSRPSLFPGSQLMPDLLDPGRIWVRHLGSNSLFGYSLGPGTPVRLPLVGTVTLSGAAEGSFLALADGSFLHFTGAGWERLFVQGKRFELPWSNAKATPFRTLRAQRLDQIYVLGTDGELGLYQLGAPLSRLWQRDVSPLPVDIATGGDTVFMLRAARAGGDALSWTLQAIHRKRPDVLVPVGSEGVGAFRDDWYARLLARYGLAASSRWVAVGGTGQLRVWHAETLEPVDIEN